MERKSETHVTVEGRCRPSQTAVAIQKGNMFVSKSASSCGDRGRLPNGMPLASLLLYLSTDRGRLPKEDAIGMLLEERER